VRDEKGDAHARWLAGVQCSRRQACCSANPAKPNLHAATLRPTVLRAVCLLQVRTPLGHCRELCQQQVGCGFKFWCPARAKAAPSAHQQRGACMLFAGALLVQQGC
jgi:hypothetical protein